MQTILNRELALSKDWCRAIGVFSFVLLTALGAFVRIPLPFTPVPLTMQTFFVLLAAASLGGNLGAVTQLIYIGLGLSGMSVFTGSGSGMFYLFGPTSGYLFGFVLASIFISGFIKKAESRPAFVFLLFLTADFLLLTCGTLWLKFVLGVSIRKASLMGFIPFAAGDIIKVFAVTALFLKFKARFREIF
ncbi:MAG: biotin transporter BioY [Candidatus Omnitrophica bacterium]|nr:biotin transporter BioY [Candidatus Omnitrophota bacterium]